jgi:hypothetical protein
MRRGADRLRVPALRPQPGNLVESQSRAGGDDEIVIVDAAARTQQQRILLRDDPLRAIGVERDALPAQRLRGIHLDVARLRQPTATHGLDGVNENSPPSPITVTV